LANPDPESRAFLTWGPRDQAPGWEKKSNTQFFYFSLSGSALKGPKHDQVEGEFFYIKQTRMVR
jgi:glucan-binding YG repeat protein